MTPPINHQVPGPWRRSRKPVAPTKREPAAALRGLSPQERLQERLEDRRLSDGWRQRRDVTLKVK